MKTCSTLHQGQKDKAGNVYIMHPLQVAGKGNDIDEVVLGLLHDVVEDTSYTLDDIRALCFPEGIVEALDAITKRPGEKREAYLYRVSGNDLATRVKYNDFESNTDPHRLSLLPADKAEWLQNQYHYARYILSEYVIMRKETKKKEVSV
jgi:(p)ppGpp synthase/HD superfamily hydrolase